MVYEAEPDGANPISFPVPSDAIEEFAEEVDLEFLLQPEEDLVEERVFELREYWRKHDLYRLEDEADEGSSTPGRHWIWRLWRRRHR